MDEPIKHFFALAIVILLVAVWILVSYARLCLCDSCKAPFAIYPYFELQYCRSCHRSWTRVRRRTQRRRSLLRRIWRTSQ